jgi:hypothetical protein
MRKPISTKMHGLMDYLTAGTLMVLPRMLGMKAPLACAVESVGATKLLYSLFTDNETGLYRKIPMNVHLAIDAASGAGLATLPFIMGDDDDDDIAKYVLVGMGLQEIMTATMTQTTPTQQSLPRQIARTTTQSFNRARERVTSGANS